MKKVIIQNFKCFYKEKEYVFNIKDKIIFLEGKNGSGKSTFLEAVVWCLTDNNLRGNFIKPFSISTKKNPTTSVEVFLEDFSVKRTLTGNNTAIELVIFEGNKTKDPDYIKNFLNSKFNNNLSWYIRQSFPNIFLSATNTEKYDLIFGSRYCDNNPTILTDKIKALLKEKKEELSNKNSFKNTVKEKKTEKEKCFSSLESVSTPNGINRLKRYLLNKKMRDERTDYFKVNSKEKIKEDLKMYKKMRTDYFKVKPYISFFENNHLSVENIDFYEYILTKSFIKPFLKKKSFCVNTVEDAFIDFITSFYNSNVTECPKCKNEIILNISSEDLDFVAQKKRNEKSKTISSFPSFSIKKFYEEKIKKLKDISQEEVESTLFFNLKEYYECYLKIKGKEQFIEDIEKINTLFYVVSEEDEIEFEQLFDQITYEDVVSYENYISLLKTVDTTELEKEIENIQSLYEIVLDASKSFLNRKLKAFEERINYYLYDLFESGFKIILNINTQKNLNSISLEFGREETGKDDESVSSRREETGKKGEPFFPSLIFDNIKYLSGGEYNKLNIALSLAFQSLENNRILILDETLNSIDQDFKEKIIEIIRDYTSFKNVLFVSHSNISGGLYDFKLSFPR